MILGRPLGFVMIVAALLLGACTSSSSNTTEAGNPTEETASSTVAAGPPSRVLFVGNSLTFYREGLANQMTDLAGSANPPVSIEAEESTRGGATLEDHWETLTTPETIADGGFDIVVVQGDIPLSDLDAFHRNARNLIVATRDAAAEPVLFMAWAYDSHPWITTDEIAQAHTEIGTEFDVDVAPVGLAFEQASRERPELNMLSSDNVHQSTHGMHLSTFVIYMTLFGTDPPDTLTDLVEGDPITQDDLTFLLRVARETVDTYAAAHTS